MVHPARCALLLAMHDFVTITLNLSVSPDKVETTLAVLHEQMLQAGHQPKEGEIILTRLQPGVEVRPPTLTVIPRMYC